MDVTESLLAGALERFYVTVESGGGDGRGNLLTARGPVADADETAESLFATLGRMAALREPRPADADLCARCLNQFKPGQVCDSCREIAAGPWAGEPDTPADPEVAAIAALAPALAAVRALDHDARTRVMEWARCRVHAGLPPF